ncbi:flagellar basal body rod protein FlgB [Clostridium niameyense]|uniref:Flagellar basal body rod protein FlgB n=1 Tax=Clostridium niameyense TaxID=1622073 RepID=A0A6M0R6S6_9CLOT|nr:flagellar basal body rod protein FlgB [Clostridium niameyense]NEZ45885.1 flagellar basal body rod protein FlgB [Clostridium niameyense]
MTINSMSQEQRTYYLLKKGMDASSYRSKVISNNTSNFNTPGYKRHYVTFEDSLNNSMDNLSMKITKGQHINDGISYGDIKEEVDRTSSMRTDGNNVDLDHEMVNKSSNALMYSALITQANNKLSTTKYVINGR